jgi:hypothetical protein
MDWMPGQFRIERSHSLERVHWFCAIKPDPPYLSVRLR